MKKNILLLIFTVLLIFSCVKDEDRVFEGFTFRFSNHTGKEHNVKVFIGGLENGNFIPTDSISIVPSIKINGNNSYYFGGENRWKPNLNLIRKTSSNNCYFLLKLSDNKEIIVSVYGIEKFFNIDISNGKEVSGNEGRVRIYIYDDKVYGENE